MKIRQPFDAFDVTSPCRCPARIACQSKKTSYEIFVLSLQLGIVNLTRFLAKHLSQPFTLGARFHGFR